MTTKVQTTKIETCLAALGHVLPEPRPPIASFLPYTIQGSMVFVSGQLPMGPDGLLYIGKLGQEISLEDGRKAAELCTLNILAQLKAAGGGKLDVLRRCLRLGVFVNATPDFTDHPEVANGASDLLVAVLGEDGKHARAALGVSSLPRGVAVEVEGLFEIF